MSSPNSLSSPSKKHVCPLQSCQLVADLLGVASATGAAALPWRYVVTANTYLEFLLPCLNGQNAGPVMEHFAGERTAQYILNYCEVCGI